MSKRLVIAVNRMGTAHVQHVLHNLFPESRIAKYDRLYVPINSGDWGVDFRETILQEGLPWGQRLLLNDPIVLQEADIFIDSGRRELVFPVKLFEKFDDVIALNRNIRDLLISMVTVEGNFDETFLTEFFYAKNLMYKRLVGERIPVFNISVGDIVTQLVQHYDVEMTEGLSKLQGERSNVGELPTKETIEQVDVLLERLGVEQKEHELAFIPRFV